MGDNDIPDFIKIQREKCYTSIEQAIAYLKGHDDIEGGIRLDLDEKHAEIEVIRQEADRLEILAKANKLRSLNKKTPS